MTEQPAPPWAAAWGDLSQDHWAVIAIQHNSAEMLLEPVWEYFLPNLDGRRLHSLRDKGILVTACSRVAGEWCLLAKWPAHGAKK